MSASDEAAIDDCYDMVLRFRPDGAEQPDLRRAISGILTETDLHRLLGKETPLRLRVLQPVVGSAPAVWELRLSVPRLSQLGEVLDWASKRGSGGRDEEDDPTRTILGRLTNIDGFKVVDEGVPLFRAWQIS